jgi:hypothetical protein
MLIMLVETVHAIVREVMLAPAIGDLRARQWGVLVGSILVLTIVCALSGWLRATTRRVRWMLGGYWVALTVVFEVLVGRVTNQTWSRVLANYNPAEGGCAPRICISS